jgi:hypothetical protein
MTDKEYYISFWNIPPDRADQEWERKLMMDKMSNESYHYVMCDIPGYKSMVTGEWVSSRSKHRNHLKEHGLIEIGNEKVQPKKQYTKDPTIRRDVINAVRSILG